MSVEDLTLLLKEAETFHRAYEINVLNGERDENWQKWYAAYIISHYRGDRKCV